MPIYDYHCDPCQKDFEILIRNDQDREDLHCPDCQNKHLRQLLSMPAKPVMAMASSTPCGGEGPSCGAPWCQRGRN
ncbi:zinc ribbon domain-containing protein [Telmatocola sphagniphila]|uniref:Zinc ribbon domain-containing protein n=1 Tax=Telmatocola sphagniphila TaxID=1123043 RepID=A0A8E6EWU3_9BACT|nr:zinc ribbon domain-containing protein [Telmatocola sphagniphila]QVL34330.1 zinc ribbon domain-containing protein [Telmatocola sphagniphila]